MNELEAFLHLKKLVETTYKSRYPGCVLPIHDWKGREITDFQEDLQLTVKGTVSERWFYTHFKPTKAEKLPRIDTLDLLSQYCGYQNWRDFKVQQIHAGTELVSEMKGNIAKNFSFKTIGFSLLGGLLILMLSAWIYFKKEVRQCEICFQDSDYKLAVSDDGLNLNLIKEGKAEVPLQPVDGCIHLKLDHKQIAIAVKAPYFITDTFYLEPDLLQAMEIRELKPDNYALMIHIFSQSKVEDWQKRRVQMGNMIADNAEIFQIQDQNKMGMEMYNKTDFIEKMTTPLRSLRNVEVLEAEYEAGKIVYLKFIQKEKNEAH